MEETAKGMIPQNQIKLFYFIMLYNGHLAKNGICCFKRFNNSDFAETDANYYILSGKIGDL